MKKHRFNVFPEAKEEDLTRLIEDIRQNGYDAQQPVVLYQGDILDGWNRHLACQQLHVKYPTREFRGTDTEAILLVLRSNKRRNLYSSQWACIAAEAEDLLKAISAQVAQEKAKRNREAAIAQHSGAPGKKLPDPKKPDDAKAATKAAEAFHTNRTYVNQAVKMRAAAPDVFEKVKAGKLTMQDARREVARRPDTDWRADERERQKAVQAGKTVLANAQTDKNLVLWAERSGLAVLIDRTSRYGNPFVLDEDGDRDAVCDSFEQHYLPHKPSLLKRIEELRGKVLVCHCYPKRCHGEALLKLLKDRRGS